MTVVQPLFKLWCLILFRHMWLLWKHVSVMLYSCMFGNEGAPAYKQQAVSWSAGGHRWVTC